MQKLLSPYLAAAILFLGMGGSALAQPAQRVRFSGGTVTVVADNAPAAELLAEWGGSGAEVLGGEQLAERRVTLNLVNVPEEQALQAILGPDFSFGATQGPAGPGSRFARIVVLKAFRNPVKAQPDEHAPPEARFSYIAPAHAVSTGDVFLSDVVPVPPMRVGPMPDPETLFDYVGPQKTKLKFPGSEAAGGAQIERNTAGPTVEPESRFGYFMSSKALPPTKPAASPAKVPAAEEPAAAPEPRTQVEPTAARPKPASATPCATTQRKRADTRPDPAPPCSAKSPLPRGTGSNR